ncbi:Peptidylprolyl isomerase, partial [Meloidogyne graminicola]
KNAHIPSIATLNLKEANIEDELILENKPKKREDSIPVIEIRGEGKPMSAAQIRELEEMSNGGPLDIKISKTWIPGDCPRKARRLDFITFHYKGFSEAGKKFDQSYGREKDGIKIQLGVGMIMPGLDKGLKGMCNGELRKIEVPWRLSRKKKSKIWRFIPNDEHWLRFDIEAIKIEPWTIEKQFEWMDINNDTKLIEKEIIEFGDKIRKQFGKTWPNEDIDNVLAAKYYIRYFDLNNDGIVELVEFKQIFERDLNLMKKN